VVSSLWEIDRHGSDAIDQPVFLRDTPGPAPPGEFGCRDQSNVARPSSSYDYNVLLVYYLVEHRGQVLAKTGI